MLDRFFNFLMGNPSQEEMMALRASNAEAVQFRHLSDALKEGEINLEERPELEYFMKAAPLIRMAKIRTHGEMSKK